MKVMAGGIFGTVGLHKRNRPRPPPVSRLARAAVPDKSQKNRAKRNLSVKSSPG
jgi:hypothetical protein